MAKLLVVLATVLLPNCRISYSCIGLGGVGSRNRFCTETYVAKSLHARDGGKTNGKLRILQKTRMQSPFVSTIDNASKKFSECCRRRGLPTVCLQKCSYVSYDQNVLRRMFLQADPCPLPFANEIHFCAAQGHDHRQCCIMNGVTTTLAGQKCLIFCDQKTQNGTILDVSYLPCFERFDSIKGCFWSWAQMRYQLEEQYKRSESGESRTNTDRVMQFNTEQSTSPHDTYP